MKKRFRYPFRSGDSTRGADETAEMTADALRAYDTRLAFLAESDRLMTTVRTRDIAPSAAYAFVAVNLRINNRVAVKVRRQFDTRQFFSD